MNYKNETGQSDGTAHPSLLEQYRKLKAQHPDAIFLFRDKDTYVTYFDDAANMSKILGISLTDNGVKTASILHSELNACLPKLIRAGKRVAICEQINKNKKEDEKAQCS